MKRFLLPALLSGACFCLSLLPAQSLAQEGRPAQEKPALFAPILVSVPTDSSVILNLVNAELPLKGELRYRKKDGGAWATLPVDLPANDMDNLRVGAKNFSLSSLAPATRYEFELVVDGEVPDGGQGSFLTRRPKQENFTFGIMTDAHVNPVNPERSPVLRACADTLARHTPDFVMHLGDNLQTVGSSHGGPAAEENHPNIFYIYMRQVLGELQSSGAQFFLNGNWEGENGWHPETNKAWARSSRMGLAPNPNNKTFPQGGSPNEDYFAFTWGGALFVSLNATGYNTINHEHTRGPGKADDWTLGTDQFAWLEKTLAESKEPWKFLFIHHAVGGNAGTDVDSRYGRGGGRAAYVGEQAKVHALMQKYGVEVFFYGHDHVFTDMTVDGIHYICNGSAGAPWKFTTDETGYEDFIPESGFVLVDMSADKAVVRYMRPDPAEPMGKELYKVELKPLK